MDRIAIVGWGCGRGGSGKSRLARILGTALGITPVHLDGLYYDYYDRDWKPPDKEEFAASDLTLVRGDLLAVPDAIMLSRRMLATIKGNLFWAFGYNTAAIPLAALGSSIR